LFVLIFSSLIVSGCSSAPQDPANPHTTTPLKVGISPYQDIAMIVNVKNLGLEKKYGTDIELITLPWEDILPAVASKGETVDVGFGSLAEYLQKVENLNKNSDDPVLFVYPNYVFKGCGFVCFNPAVPEITPANVNDPATLRKFLSFKLGAQKNSQNDMLLILLAHKAGVPYSQLHITDITINDGLLAAEQGSLDAAAAGLTQRTEALKRHGRVVLTMETLGAADVDGFVCKESILKRRRQDIQSLVHMWLDCSKYVTSDIEHHTGAEFAYLSKNAATKYTIAEFKRALTQEYFPTTLEEVQENILAPNSKYSVARERKQVGDYLVDIGAVKAPPQMPKMTLFEPTAQP